LIDSWSRDSEPQQVERSDETTKHKTPQAISEYRPRNTFGGGTARTTAPYNLPTETLTLLFTDIEGSTRLLERLGPEAYTGLLAEHHALVRSALATHGGNEVSTQGDSFFATFTSPSAALAAVVDMQRALLAHAWPNAEQLRVRMGVHAGEAAETPAGLVGLDIHRAARLAAVAHGGQVVLSEAAAVLARQSLLTGASLRSLGLHRLKDLGRPEHIFQLEAPGLEPDFPPLRSLDNPMLKNNLPAQLTSFIGRGPEVADLRALVESSRLVTLTGLGGSGKTRLALQVAAELLDGAGDGVWFVDLAPVETSDHVPSAVASVLKVREQPARSLTETLCLELADRSLLILLDNCEHLIDACAKLADALGRACPRLHVLATSREPLGIYGECVHRVLPLSVPAVDAERPEEVVASEGAMLFYERARAHQEGFVLNAPNSSAVASICRRLDGIPLAIELAAARMRTMSVADIADRLHDRFRLLTGGGRTAVPRQQTLQTSIDWSYALLNQPERTALARLSVFAGGFDLGAADAVAGADEADAFRSVDLVSSLVDKSLVQAEVLATRRTRYRLLESVREYASARLATPGARDQPTPEEVQTAPAEKDGRATALDAMRREPLATRWRHAIYFLSVAEDLAPKLRQAAQLEAIERLNLEIDNLRAALGTLQEHGPAEMLRMLVALGYYWLLRGQLSETLGWYDLSPVGDESQDPDARAALVMMSTLIQLFGGDLEGGARKLSELEKVTHRCRDRCRWEAWSSMLTAFTKIFEPDLARALAREAVEKMLLCGGPWDLGAVLTMQGEVERVAGNITAAEPLYRRALELFEQEGDRFWLCVNILNVGECAVQSGDYEAAVPVLVSMLPPLREMGNEFLMAYCCLAMGCAAAGLRQWQEACLVLGAGLGWLERRGMSLEPVEYMMVTRARSTLTTAIGENALEELLGAGRHARPEQAIEQCLLGLGMGREAEVGGGGLQATTSHEPHQGN